MMPLDPDENPKEFLTVILAIGLKIFGPQTWDDSERFNAAERFIIETERRYGPLNK